MQRSKTQTVVWVGYVVSVCEAVDDHDARVVGIGEACRVDDAMGSWWNADMVGSATPNIMKGE